MSKRLMVLIAILLAMLGILGVVRPWEAWNATDLPVTDRPSPRPRQPPRPATGPVDRSVDDTKLLPAKQDIDRVWQSVSETLRERSLLRVLGPPVRNIHVASDGELWFVVSPQVSTSDTRQGWRKLIEYAWSRQARIVCGARLLLVDRQQRLWVQGDARTGQPAGVSCYTGTRWIEPDAPSTVAPSTLRRSPGYEYTHAWEDASGNIFFRCRRDDGVHLLRRYDANGRWDDYEYARSSPDGFSPTHGDEVLFENPAFHQTPEGVVVVYVDPAFRSTEQQRDRRSMRFLTYAGGSWAASDLSFETPCRLPELIPAHDGTMVMIDQGKRARRFFATGATVEQTSTLRDAIGRLGDPDPVKRNAAMVRVTELAGFSLPRARDLFVAGGNKVIPEISERLGELVRLYQTDAFAADVVGAHAGRYLVDQPKILTRTLDGRVLIVVTHALDLQTKQEVGHAVLSVDRDWNWALHPLAGFMLHTQWQLERFRGEGDLPLPRGKRLVDGQSRIWVETGRYLDADFNVHNALPPGMRSGMSIRLIDRQGRIVSEPTGNGRFLICDPDAPEPVEYFPRQSYRCQAIQSTRGETYAWGVDCTVWPHELIRFGGKERSLRVPGDWDDAQVYDFAGLGEAALVLAASKDPHRESYPKPFRFWNSEQWQAYDTCLEAIHDNGAFLARTMKMPKTWTLGAFSVYLCPDGVGGLWCVYTAINEDPQRRRRQDVLFFQEGKWIDVLHELALDRADTLGQVLPARWASEQVVLAGGDGTASPVPMLIEREHRTGRFRKTPLEPEQFRTLANVSYYRQPQHERGEGEIVGSDIDPHRRLWHAVTPDGAASTVVKVTLPDGRTAACDRGSRLHCASFIGASDGAWLLDDEGISRLTLDATHAKPTLSIGKIEKWGFPRLDLTNGWADGDGGVWLPNAGSGWTRFEPQATAPG